MIIGIIATILLEVFAGNIAHLLQVPAESFDKAVTYIRICSGGILIIIAYNVISSILRGVGNANLPFLFVGIACIVNIVGDLLLVGVFKMDVTGAAIATIAAQGGVGDRLSAGSGDVRISPSPFPFSNAGYSSKNCG